MSTDHQPQIALSIESIRKDGKQKLRASAYLGDTLLHMHAFDFDSDHSRSGFLRRVAEKALQHGIEAPTESLEAELLEAAQNMMLGLAPDGSSADDEPESAEVLADNRAVLGAAALSMDLD